MLENQRNQQQDVLLSFIPHKPFLTDEKGINTDGMHFLLCPKQGNEIEGVAS